MGVSTNLAVFCACVCLAVLAVTVTSDPVPQARSFDDNLARLLQRLQASERHQRSSEEQPDDDGTSEHVVTVDDIMGAMQKRSEVASGSMTDVMGAVADSYRRMQARTIGRSTDPKNCIPNPCAHKEKCSTTDLMPGTDYMCYDCKSGYSGVDCGVYDVCYKKRAPPAGGHGRCKAGELCIPSANTNGYFCF